MVPVACRLIAPCDDFTTRTGHRFHETPVAASLFRFASVMTRWLFRGIAPDPAKLSAESESTFNILSHLRLQTLVRTDMLLEL